VKIDDFKSEKFREFIIKLDEKLLLDNSSLAPNSPSGEQKPPITKTSEQKLYDQYLKDTSYIDFSKIPKPSENPEPKTESSLLSPLQWVQDHTCHYRAVVKEKGGSFSIYCDTKKIPLEVCVTRQKRFLFMKKNCKPIGYKPPQKQWQQRTQQDDRTRPYKGDTEAYFDPFSVGDGYQ
jgi:hypothetical protein